MDYFLVILAFAALLTGLAGAILPLPGPPLSFIGLLLLKASGLAVCSQSVLITYGTITVVVSVLDYYVPIWGIKKFGGTKGGMWGSTIGVVLGFFVVPAVGIFLGAFLGAFIGEVVVGTESAKALKAAIGSFIGFLTGILMKTTLCIAMVVYAVMALL